MAKDHGNCPHCGVNLNGGLIYDTFMEKYGNHEEALRAAEMYGATQTEGMWGREIAIYDFMKDKTVAYKCPDCGKEWAR